MAHFGIYIILSKAGCLRTVFAEVIGDVGVIMEVFVEQRSYFGLIDFLTATGNVIQVRLEFQPSPTFFVEINRAPWAATEALSFQIYSL